MSRLFLRDTVCTGALLLVFLTLAAWLAAPLQLPAAAVAMNSEAWRQAMQLRLSHPHLQRYVLLPLTSAQEQPLNFGSDGKRVQAPMTVGSTCRSHQQGLAAYRLDRQPVESAVFDITGDFTVEGWFRWHGPGQIVGANNGGAGTVLALGDGVHDGFGLSLRFHDGSLQLGLGRPAPKTSFVTAGTTRLPPGLWAHLAVVRQSRQVRLYLNGLLTGCGESDVPTTQPPAWRKFRIGYVGNGDSSIRLDVGEWAVFSAALQDQELARLAELPDDQATHRLQAARTAFCLDDSRRCQELLAQIPPQHELAAAVRFTAAEILRRQQQPDAALLAFKDVAGAGNGYWQRSAALEATALQLGGDHNFAAALAQWADRNAAAEQQTLAAQFNAAALPVLQQHCSECHGGAVWCSAPAERTVEQLLSAKLWSGVQSRLADHSMPPPGCPPLPITLRRQVLYWIQELPPPNPCEQQLTEERRRRLSPLAAVGRRLTRTEFAVALQQLLGVSPGADLLPPPEGAGGEGFDTAAGTLVMSSSTAELFFSSVSDAVSRALDGADVASEPSVANAEIPIVSVLQALSGSQEDLEPALRRFVRLAWRGAVSDADWLRLQALQKQLLEDGLTPQQTVAELLQAVLLSPAFLYVLETPPQPAADFRISPHEFATRMALFLWSGIPDESLLQAADQNLLQTEQQILSQVRRMLQQPLADNLGRSFGLQWLGIQQLTTQQKDRQLFPEYSPEIARLMQEEAWRLVAAVFREDRPLEELLTADYVWVNSQLAQYYGLPFPENAVGWQRVDARQSGRGGLLTLGGVMVAGSYPTRTSPVLRGRWILDRILGQQVLPAPADVPALEQTVGSHPELTLRQQMELHREKPTCRVCHEAMDPLGFALEEFDAVGQLRASQNGHPVDAAAVLPDGTAVQGVAGLRQEILRRRSQWLPHLVRRLTGYAAGRELFESERCLLEEITSRTVSSGGTGTSLICSILQSDVFRLRRITAESGKVQSE